MTDDPEEHARAIVDWAQEHYEGFDSDNFGRDTDVERAVGAVVAGDVAMADEALRFLEAELAGTEVVEDVRALEEWRGEGD